jgi:acyl dehydratase
VVDGQIFGALLAEQLQDWLGPRAFIRRLHFRFRSLVFAGETVRCEATVIEVHDDRLIVECRVVVPAHGDAPERVAVAPAGAEVVLRVLPGEGPS